MNSSQRASYPRTGRRGVPQQFPIKLYGMLESETEKAKAKAEADGMIRWSESGKAFHIEDSAVFAALVLPKYFRTSKFSSFQRNLNLVSLFINIAWPSLIHIITFFNLAFFSMGFPR